MVETKESLNLKSFLSSVRLSPDVATPTPMLQSNLEQVIENVSTEERFISSMAAVVFNMNPDDARFDKQSIQDLVANIDALVEDQLNEILHTEAFQKVEAAWTSIAEPGVGFPRLSSAKARLRSGSRASPGDWRKQSKTALARE